jgi:hypothetical protein
MILETNMTDKQVKIKVTGRHSVAFDGKRYVDGDSATVPEAVAAEWEREGWAERVSTSSKK